jgi:hypothetical protein
MQPRQTDAAPPTTAGEFVGRPRELAQAVTALARPHAILVVEGSG